MKVITADAPSFIFTPRFYSENPVITLDNGFEISATIQNNLVNFLDTSIFSEGETYCFTITADEKIVYKGKIIFLKNGTDVQNYNANTQNSKRWQ